MPVTNLGSLAILARFAAIPIGRSRFRDTLERVLHAVPKTHALPPFVKFHDNASAGPRRTK